MPSDTWSRIHSAYALSAGLSRSGVIPAASEHREVLLSTWQHTEVALRFVHIFLDLTSETMSRYAALTAELRKCDKPIVTYSFDELDAIVGGLPPSAYAWRLGGPTASAVNRTLVIGLTPGAASQRTWSRKWPSLR